ncbi:MAG: 3-phosphoshikimate 1-carboxyvinyltransferase [Ignavibacteriaceae bacterium]|nr:3-phosphoshikimate 1-carboxyvinyltransferase [Ignavibacteriaceae bacterium]MCW8817859.1 3-phosphoshikimate 1-carboxyvinyltransferase [Ignavibacteriaceae bacterium]
MIQSFNKINQIKGEISFSGDKSISHRALLISSLAEGKSRIKNLSDNDDVKATIKCLQDLGIEIDSNGEEVAVNGRGFKGYQKPPNQLNASNSGTTARLLAGILSAQNFESVISGELSLSSRPMNRIVEPLTLMGGVVKSIHGKLPLHIYPSDKLNSITYEMPIASAQVKSAILLAGLHLDSESRVIESRQTRNHTETFLNLNVIKEEGKIISSVSKKNYPHAKDYFIPGDVSSAMYFIVLTLVAEKSELLIKDVSLNPTRIKGLSLLKKMGGNIQIEFTGESNKELFGNVLVKSSYLSNVKIDPKIIPLIIDEIPILAVSGVFAEGAFEIRDAGELRVKESDRIKSLISNFRLLGLEVEEYTDGFRISGEVKKTVKPFNSYEDHRVAMAFAILSCLLEDGGKVEGFESVSKSNPDFLQQLKSISS